MTKLDAQIRDLLDDDDFIDSLPGISPNKFLRLLKMAKMIRDLARTDDPEGEVANTRLPALVVALEENLQRRRRRQQ